MLVSAPFSVLVNWWISSSRNSLLETPRYEFGRGFLYRGPARVNSDKQHDPKVATERKMKSRQEATSLGQIAT